VADLQDIVRDLKQRGVSLRATEQPIDTSTAAGKAFLARLPNELVRKAIDGMDLKALTEKTITTRESFLSEIEDVRKQGYAIDDEEHALGVRCVSAAVVDENGAPVASISVSGPVTRMEKARLSRLGQLIRGAAQEITRDYGGVDRQA
jgi:IclR family acetate operon transcriptional repressor